MASEQRVYVKFDSTEFDDIAPNLFEVVAFDGVEIISQAFRFEVDLISEEANIDIQALMGKAATLEINREDTVRKIHGVICAMEKGEETQFDTYSYKAVLVPRLWLMSLSRQNQIHQQQTVQQIVEQEMTLGDFTGGMLKDELEFRLSKSYAEREYTVQYKETDLNFVSRLLEHEGIFYTFDHSQSRERIIFCDDNAKLDPLIEQNTVSYVPPSGLASFNGQAIHNFRLKQQQISKAFLLKDYNYRKPDINLQGEADTDELRLVAHSDADDGDIAYGRVCEYGDHFKDFSEASQLAKVRAQAQLCQQQTFTGSSDAILFAAGKIMAMQGHYSDDLNGEYLITHIRHRGGQALPGVSAASSSGQAIAYQNDFEAIAAQVQYRPPLKAIKPKLYGILTAKVDGAIDSDRAQIDDEGRYKLVMPFDVSGTGEGKASRWVRKAESYGGQGTGMGFPLLKGSEVIWSCIDGDPDRPIITGVVPNPLNKSVVTAKNSTDNVIKTPSGIMVQMRDGKGARLPPEQEGTEQSQTRIQQEASAKPVASSDCMEAKDNIASLIQQQQYSSTDVNVDVSTDNVGSQKSYSIYVPQYRSGTGDKPLYSYSRMGCFELDEMELFGADPSGSPTDHTNVYYREGTYNPENGLPWTVDGNPISSAVAAVEATEETAAIPAQEPLKTSFEEASDGGHKIMDVLNATMSTYDISASDTWASGLYEGLDPARFGLMEYTDGAKLMVHWNGCFDLAAGTSVTYDSLGANDSLITVVLGQNPEVTDGNDAVMIKSERFHCTNDEWVTETWEKSRAYSFTKGEQESIFVGHTWEYFAGTKYAASVGLSFDCTLASQTSFVAGVNTEVKFAADINFASAIEFNCVASDSVDICAGDNELKGKTVLLQYEPPAVTKSAVAIPLGVVAGVMAATGSTIAGVGMNKALQSPGNVKEGTQVLYGGAVAAIAASAAANATGIGMWAKNKLASKASTNSPIAPLPFVKVEENSITLRCGAASIVLDGLTGNIKIIGNDILTTTDPLGGKALSYVHLGPGASMRSQGKIVIDSTTSTSVYGQVETKVGRGAPSADFTGKTKILS